jgi:hypothetical protein
LLCFPGSLFCPEDGGNRLAKSYQIARCHTPENISCRNHRHKDYMSYQYVTAHSMEIQATGMRSDRLQCFCGVENRRSAVPCVIAAFWATVRDPWNYICNLSSSVTFHISGFCFLPETERRTRLPPVRVHARLCTRLKLFLCAKQPTRALVLYGCETWSLTLCLRTGC